METGRISSNINYLVQADQPFVGALLRYGRAWMSLALALTDMISLASAFGLALFVRMQLLNGLFDWLGLRLADPMYIAPQVYLDLRPLIVLFVGLFALRGLYPGAGMGPVEELRRLWVNTSFLFLGLLALWYFERANMLYSRAILAMAWGFALFFLPFNRTFVRFWLVKWKLWGEPVGVAGDAESCARLARHLRENPKIGLVPVAAFVHSGTLVPPHAVSVHAVSAHAEIEGLAALRPEHFERAARRNHIACCLVGGQGLRLKPDELKDFQGAGRLIVVDTSQDAQLLWVTVQDVGGLMGYQLNQNLNDPWPQLVKRTIDVLVALGGLAFLSPLFLLITAFIRLDSPGLAYYYQVRVGKDGRKFRFIKFRTMYQDADQRLAEMIAADPCLRSEWQTFQKLKEDPRITRVGKFLRRWSLDELPQLINVLFGQMSLIGPRPFFPAQETCYGDTLDQYMRVRPGLTGLWQVSGRNHTTFAERASMDTYYVRNWSIWLDLYIFARTFWVVIKTDGAY